MTEEEAPRQVQETTSSFFKIARALDGSDFWVSRLTIALEMYRLEPSRRNMLTITQSVVDSIDAMEDGAVYTDRVTDEQIISAINHIAEGTPEVEE